MALINLSWGYAMHFTSIGCRRGILDSCLPFTMACRDQLMGSQCSFVPFKSSVNSLIEKGWMESLVGQAWTLTKNLAYTAHDNRDHLDCAIFKSFEA